MRRLRRRRRGRGLLHDDIDLLHVVLDECTQDYLVLGRLILRFLQPLATLFEVVKLQVVAGYGERCLRGALQIASWKLVSADGKPAFLFLDPDAHCLFVQLLAERGGSRQAVRGDHFARGVVAHAKQFAFGVVRQMTAYRHYNHAAHLRHVAFCLAGVGGFSVKGFREIIVSGR